MACSSKDRPYRIWTLAIHQASNVKLGVNIPEIKVSTNHLHTSERDRRLRERERERERYGQTSRKQTTRKEIRKIKRKK